VSPERDEPSADQEYELYDDVTPRSIFAATWFRIVLVVIVLGVIGAVAVPYVFDRTNQLPPPQSVAAPEATPVSEAPSERAPGDRSASEKLPSQRAPADRRDSTLVPAPATAPLAAAPARPEPKGEPKSPPTPAVESKSSAGAALPETKTPTAAKIQRAAAAAASPEKATATKSTPGTQHIAAKSDGGKGDAPSLPATKPSAARQAAVTAATPAAGARYWVQVGAFKDAEAARRLASKLREEKYTVEGSVKRGGATPTPVPRAVAAAPGSEQYDVFVSGLTTEDLNRRLAGKGLRGETESSGGVVVRPSLPLRDAVALSKDLAVDGLKVQVRRAGGNATSPAAPPPAIEGDRALHRVRVGVFADKGTALAAARELEAKGYKPYIVRGDQ
jgi:cell division protein FtsN